LKDKEIAIKRIRTSFAKKKKQKTKLRGWTKILNWRIKLKKNSN
jgi:hypothetical protein